MNIYTVDAETFFSDEFTLKKLSTEEYVRGPEFAVHGWAVRHPDGKTEWLGPEAFKCAEWQQVLTNSAVLAHHAHFDLFILSHHYNIHPKVILCTLSMARLLLGNHVSVSLDSVREHFGMPFKRTPYDKFKGKHWGELDDATRQEIAAGACDEVESIWQIFNAFMRGAY